MQSGISFGLAVAWVSMVIWVGVEFYSEGGTLTAVASALLYPGYIVVASVLSSRYVSTPHGFDFYSIPRNVLFYWLVLYVVAEIRFRRRYPGSGDSRGLPPLN